VIGGLNRYEESAGQSLGWRRDPEQRKREELERKEKEKNIWRFDISNLMLLLI